MRRMIPVAALAAVLIGLAARQADALWRLWPLKPGSLSAPNYTFEVRARDVDALKELRITVKGRDGKRLPQGTHAELTLTTSEARVGSVPVAGKAEGDTTVYRFRLSPQAAEHSRFELSVPRFPPEPGKVEIPGGGEIFTMKIADFIPRARN